MPTDHEAIANTVAAIYGGSRLSSLVNQSSLHQKLPSKEATEYLQALTESAHKGTESRPYDSVLVGQSSEADGYGDVSFWIGPGRYGSGNETEVLKALGLSSDWALERKIRPLELSSSTHLPTFLIGADDDEAVSPLVGLLKKLNDVYAFTSESEIRDGPAVLYILLGRFGDEGWAGLVSVGIVS